MNNLLLSSELNSVNVCNQLLKTCLSDLDMLHVDTRSIVKCCSAVKFLYVSASNQMSFKL